MHVCSVSFGKDSLCMVLKLIELGKPVDIVVYYDTGVEFEAIYHIKEQIKPYLYSKGIEYIELKPDYDFFWKMFDKPVHGKNGFHHGYSWCGGPCRWGTTDKLESIKKLLKLYGAYDYVGIAADEAHRIPLNPSKAKLYPLVEWGMTERDCLEYCYGRGFTWQEGSVRLYDILSRVSCWCCANKNLKELKNIYLHLPEYWEKLKYIQSRTSRPMKGPGKSVYDLEQRFAYEVQKDKESVDSILLSA